jgi:hypothetical protein
MNAGHCAILWISKWIRYADQMDITHAVSHMICLCASSDKHCVRLVQYDHLMMLAGM